MTTTQCIPPCNSLQRPWCLASSQLTASITLYYSPLNEGFVQNTYTGPGDTTIIEAVSSPLWSNAALTTTNDGDEVTCTQTVYNLNGSPLSKRSNGVLTIWLQGVTITCLFVGEVRVVKGSLTFPEGVYQYEISSGTGLFFNQKGYVKLTISDTPLRTFEVFFV